MKRNLMLIRLIFVILLAVSIISGVTDLVSGFSRGWESAGSNSPNIVKNVLFKPNDQKNTVLMRRENADSISFSKNYYSDVEFKNNEDSSSLISFFMFIVAIVVVVLGIKVLVNFYRFLNALVKEEVFTLQNVKRLFRMGIFIACISPLEYFFYYLNFMNAQKMMKPYSFTVLKNFDFDVSPLMFGLILIAISYVFKKGIEMQQEQDLTI
ncbi:MAG: DUF2975 domain-containing protein [Ginsengibacter sp.]